MARADVVRQAKSGQEWPNCAIIKGCLEVPDSGSFRQGVHLAKSDLIDVQGMVTAVHSGGIYRVECDPGHEVLAQLSGKMRRFRIKVVPGDRVTVGVSPYDMTRGFITFRTR